MSVAPKKRNRKILVCYNCRMKKNKCDRENPCSSCKRLGIQDSCKYGNQLPPLEASFFPREKSQASDEPIVDKQQEIVSSINIHPHFPVYHNDPAYRMLWTFWLYQSKDVEYSKFILSNRSLGIDGSKQNLETKYFPEISTPIDYSILDHGALRVTSTKTLMNQYGKNIGIIYDNNYPHHENIIKKLKYTLPLESQLINLQTIFFDKICEFVPVIDEFDHEKHVNRLFNITTPSMDKIKKINITSKQDYAILAQILIINRISYIFCKLNHYPIDIDVPLESMSLVNECINIHGLINQPTLAILQALILLQFYNSMSPDKLQGFANEQTLRGNILEIVVNLGLHRDPEVLLLESIDGKMCNLRKKIWFHIYEANTFQQSLFPTVLRPLNQSFDVLWPSYNVSINNFKTPLTEKHIVDAFKFTNTFVELISRILNRIQGIHPNFDNFSSYIHHFNIATDNLLGSFDIIMKLTPGFFKILRFRNFLYSKMFATVISYIEFISLEQQGNYNESNVQLKLCFNLLFSDLGQITTGVLIDYKAKFGDMFPLIILPILILVFNLTLSISLSLILRIKGSIVNNSDVTYVAKLNFLLQIIKKFSMVRLKYLIEMCQYSKFALKVLKIHAINASIICDKNDIYNKLNDQVDSLQLNLSISDISGLMTSFDQSWYTVERENIDEAQFYTVNDILKSDPNYELKLSTCIKSDKLWTCKTLIDLYDECNVPKDDDDKTNADEEFIFNDPLFIAIPKFPGYYGLRLE